MPITKIASDCPAIPVPGTVIYKGNDGQSPPTSNSFASGVTTEFTKKLNQNSKGWDMVNRYGAGGYGIGVGLALSAGSGLTLNISDGQAVLDGIVEVRSYAGLALADNSDNWIWLKQDGTIVRETTTTPPVGNCVLLGLAVASSGAITSVGQDGAIVFRSGQMWRETNDLWAPSDTPNSILRVFTKTQGGVFFWDGSAHVHIPSGSRVAVADADHTVAASTEIVALTSLSAGRTVTLPAPVAGREILVMDESGQAGTYNITIDTASGDINGGSSVSITTNYGFKRIRSNGSAWFVVG